VSCPRCALPLPRAGLRRHMEDQCPDGVVNCPLRFIGCAASMPRKQLERHLDTTGADHLETLVRTFQQVQAERAKETAALKKEIEALRARCTSVDVAAVEQLRTTVAAQQVWIDRFVQGLVVIVDLGGIGNFTTISAAIERCQPNDAIIVRPGVYEERVVVKTDGLCLRAGGGTVEVRAPSGTALQIAAKNVEVRGIAFSTSGLENVLYLEGADSIIANCTVVGTKLGHGVVVTASASAQLIDCVIANCGHSGIDCRGKLTIRGCSVRQCKRPNINVATGGELVAVNCDVTDSEVNGVHVALDGRAQLSQCRISKNKYSNIDVVGGAAMIADCELSFSDKCGLCAAERASIVVSRSTIHSNALPNVACLAGSAVKLEACTVERGRSHGVVVKKGATFNADEATVIRDNGDAAVARE
jgi:hypothetical protein